MCDVSYRKYRLFFHTHYWYVPGPVVLKVVPVTGAAFLGFTLDHLLRASLFFTH